MARTYSLLLIGFGNVGQAFARLLLRKEQLLEEEFGCKFRVTGIATGRHGRALDAAGINLARALELANAGQSLDLLAAQPAPTDMAEFIYTASADVLFENTPVNHHSGQPAAQYLRLGLEKGMHAITANKGPVVHAYPELTALAAQRGRRAYPWPPL